MTPGLTGASETVGASEETFFTGGSCSTLAVRLVSGAAVCRVRIVALHGVTAGAVLRTGDPIQYFRVGNDKITVAFVSGENAIIDWWPAAKTGD